MRTDRRTDMYVKNRFWQILHTQPLLASFVNAPKIRYNFRYVVLIFKKEAMNEIHKKCNKSPRQNHLELTLHLTSATPQVSTQSLQAVGHYDFRITYS